MPLAIRRRITAGGTTRDTLLFAATAAADTRYIYDGADSPSSLATTNYLYVRHISSTRFNYRSFMYLTAESGRSLPANATIVSALAHIYPDGGATTPHPSRWAFEKAINPTRITQKSELTMPNVGGGRVKTSLYTWTPPGSWTAPNLYDVDVTAQAQEVRAFGSGAITNLCLFWLPENNNGYAGDNNNHRTLSYQGDPAKTVTLTVTFDVPTP